MKLYRTAFGLVVLTASAVVPIVADIAPATAAPHAIHCSTAVGTPSRLALSHCFSIQAGPGTGTFTRTGPTTATIVWSPGFEGGPPVLLVKVSERRVISDEAEARGCPGTELALAGTTSNGEDVGAKTHAELCVSGGRANEEPGSRFTVGEL